MTPQPPLFLYWVTTPDHDDDWFVFARDPVSAVSFHRGLQRDETLDPASAEAVLEIPNPSVLPQFPTLAWKNGNRYILQKPDVNLLPQGPEFPRHARAEDLTALGFECSGTLMRVVRYQGRTFLEGDEYLFVNASMDDDHEARGEGRPNGTMRGLLKLC